MKKTQTFLLTLALSTVMSTSDVVKGQESHPVSPPKSNDFVLLVHGGAGDYTHMSAEEILARRAAMKKAIEAGYKVLAHAGSSLDAVEATIRVLEDSGAFDAGRGGYYTQDGTPELDSAIMDGRTLSAGAVASVKRIANPISLARLVMEKTPHVLLVGEGAERFAESQGIELVPTYYFYNEREWKHYQELKEARGKNHASELVGTEIHGTVGVVALDQAGNLAAGTSTGGTTWKLPGRVGDSPLIGAGTYANNDSCAISATGVGEFFIRNVVAADICARVRYLHISIEEAAKDVVLKELVAQHGEGGIIGLDRDGHIAAVFNSEGMMRGVVRADGNIVIKISNE